MTIVVGRRRSLARESAHAPVASSRPPLVPHDAARGVPRRARGARMTLVRDAVHSYLVTRGCAPHVVRGGLVGLLERWRDVVEGIEQGRDGTLDEWRDDMDLRDLLAGALAAADLRERQAAALRLDDADERFRLVTLACPCVRGADVATAEGWRAAWQWWYFRRPTLPGPALRAELGAAGLL